MARAKKRNNTRRNLVTAGLSILLLLVIVGRYFSQHTIAVLQPAGPIAAGERRLLITAFLLMLLIVVPVLTIAFSFAWRYRETNKKAKYSPNWDHSRLAETIWWLIPTALIAGIAVITWHGTYAFDPHKELVSKNSAVHIQVVALDWRWLFIYPDYNVASINQLYIPVNTPITFDITADAPMNSFWIPQLGGQIYAMPGMNTQLNLMADRVGSYRGSSANISGKGFASMHFNVVATQQKQFNNWIAVAGKGDALTKDTYDVISKPHIDEDVGVYSSPATGLYSTIISKYMNSTDHMDHSHMEGM
jgi:cytochrome o ubiquinol oxidase subunit 2